MTDDRKLYQCTCGLEFGSKYARKQHQLVSHGRGTGAPSPSYAHDRYQRFVERRYRDTDYG